MDQTMSGRVVVARHGGPEVLEWRQAEVGEPGEGEVRLRHAAVGVNFIDVYFRTGAYAGPPCPFVLGMEASGVVTAVGPGVTGLAVGDRVAYASGPLGSYAEERLMVAARVVKIPASVSDEMAAAMMLKGMTAEYLLFRTYPVQPCDVVLVHAAAGGVGLILCQWAKHLGATVIGTVGTDAKAALASANGCDHPIVYTREDLVSRVKAFTGGAGAHVVFDSVGKDTFGASLDCLRPRGTMVLFGQSSGKVGPFDPQLLASKGSLFFTRPTLMSYTATRGDLDLSASRLFDVVARGAVRIQVGRSLPLREARRAHEELEGRRTMGSTVLLP
jgi:NADPH2:quinone reductase